MSRNIKEIGKELMGKSLNSFHRKTGLTQLEENNKMQDGILDGILSQVDDAYIEKTEQSNVIHLDGSGDGVVVLDSIEGNTMVNLASLKRMTIFASTGNMVCDYDGIYYKGSFYNTYYVSSISQQPLSTLGMQQGKTYTLIQYQKLDKSIYNDDTTTPRQSGFIFYDKSSGTSVHLGKDALSEMINVGETKITKTKFTVDSRATHFDLRLFTASKPLASKEVSFSYWFILLEGDYTNKEINYFEGMQSSFEEKVNDEGKYEIEILSQNRNLLSKDSWQLNDSTLVSETKDEIVTKGKNNIGGGIRFTLKNLKEGRYCFSISAKTNTQGDGSVRIYNDTKKQYIAVHLIPLETSLTYKSGFFTIPKDYERDEILIWIGKNSNYELETQFTLKKDFMLTRVSTDVSLPYEEQKQNKIKLLLNEPLRSVPNGVKDRLYVKNNKLVVERNCKYVIINGSEGNYAPSGNYNTVYRYWCSTSKFSDIKDSREDDKCICDNNVYNHTNYDTDRENINIMKTGVNLKVLKSKVNSYGSINDYLIGNPIKCIYQLAEPYYEEVLNEYGEPIILEGYENGTLYIDSTIIPTTTVRYTPKMESFKTLKEVESNNIMLTNDVNDNIIPYMMDVDLMIMEKEMALMSHKNIRKMEVLDMTSMQKRTQDMLERLIKGKTLTEQECKTRITTYLNAGKITDAQAEELMLLIDEVYA